MQREKRKKSTEFGTKQASSDFQFTSNKLSRLIWILIRARTHTPSSHVDRPTQGWKELISKWIEKQNCSSDINFVIKCYFTLISFAQLPCRLIIWLDLKLPRMMAINQRIIKIQSKATKKKRVDFDRHKSRLCKSQPMSLWAVLICQRIFVFSFIAGAL